MESTGKSFVMFWNNHAIRLPLYRFGADIVPRGFGLDYEITRHWLDFLLAELVRSWGGKITTPALLVAGVVVDDNDQRIS
jgi:hypothetical protein